MRTDGGPLATRLARRVHTDWRHAAATLGREQGGGGVETASTDRAGDRSGPEHARGTYRIRDIFGRTIWTGNAVSLKAAIRRAAGETSLAGADLSGLDLEGVVLEGADLHGASFAGSDLDGAVFSGANLANSTFAGASLRGADFSLSTLSDASLEGANVTAAILDPEDIPPGFRIEDGIVRPAAPERMRTLQARWREARRRERVRPRLSRQLAERAVAFYADHRSTLSTEPERERLDALGAELYGFLRHRASGDFLLAHRADDGFELTIAALREDDAMRRRIERRLGRPVADDCELRRALTRSEPGER